MRHIVTLQTLLIAVATSSGWGSYLIPLFTSILGSELSADEINLIIHDTWKAINPGLKYADIAEKGFFAVKMTPEKTCTEHFTISPTDNLSDYETARSMNEGGITAAFTCGGSLVTDADTPGSLHLSECGEITFDASRLEVFDINVPASFAKEKKGNKNAMRKKLNKKKRKRRNLKRRNLKKRKRKERNLK